MFSVINTISVKLLTIPSPYPVSGASLHFYFHTYFICLNKCFPIFYSEMGMAPSKLEAMLAVKLLEKGLASSYLMIIAKVFESMFQLDNANVKLEVLNNRYNR